MTTTSVPFRMPKGTAAALQRYTSGNGTVAALPGIRYLNIDCAVTALTLTFPTNPQDGQEFGVTSWYSSTGISCVASGANLAAAITGITPSTPASWVYVSVTSSWLRTH